jgi:hypothetical protein
LLNWKQCIVPFYLKIKADEIPLCEGTSAIEAYKLQERLESNKILVSANAH